MKKKYLVIEKSDNEIYTYFETEKQLEKNNKERNKTKVKIESSDLDDECCLGQYIDGCYFVFELK
jgi:UTP-glucose-1-phosphate uridylyltransferase